MSEINYVLRRHVRSKEKSINPLTAISFRKTALDINQILPILHHYDSIKVQRESKKYQFYMLSFTVCSPNVLFVYYKYIICSVYGTACYSCLWTSRSLGHQAPELAGRAESV